jgi:hypothetical protein
LSDIEEATGAIERRLADMARAVIAAHLDLTDPANRSFLEHPDGRDQHQTRWHQWGILAHTLVFLRHFDTAIPEYLRRWGMWEAVDGVLQRRVDGARKWELLRISILLHDIGKFAARYRGSERFHFTRHEQLSGQIVRSELDLARFGLTPAQIEYVARTAEDHFVLGLVRKRAREEGEYDCAYSRSESFVAVCEQIKAEHPDDYVEIGVLFLGDSLAKANPGEGPEDALSQYETNIVVARRYLEVVLGRGA